jgi:hypothetical protein
VGHFTPGQFRWWENFGDAVQDTSGELPDVGFVRALYDSDEVVVVEFD